MTAAQVAAFRRCLDAGGVVVFPTDTVYGLACDPRSRAAVRRMHSLKGRAPDKPSAVMWFDLESALALVEPQPRSAEAMRRLLPGPVTVVLPNPARHFPLACAPDHSTLGLRVPALPAALAALAALGRPLMQSSANPSGGADPRALPDVDGAIRDGADLLVDGGELPGTPSTVVDLRGYETAGTWTLLREGALPRGRVERALSSVPE